MERKQVISLSNQNFTYSNEFLANSTGNTCDRDLRAAWVHRCLHWYQRGTGAAGHTDQGTNEMRSNFMSTVRAACIDGVR